MNALEFEGSLVYGPKTFAEVTGRKKLWAKPVKYGEMKRADRSCPLCGESNRTRLFKTATGWSYVRCNVCSMVYQNPAPTPEALDAYYKEGSAPTDWVEYTQQHGIELELDRRKFRWALEKCGWPRTVGGIHNVLDVGCSTGTFLEVAAYMTRRGARLYGTEINEAAAQIAQERIFLETTIFRQGKIPDMDDLVDLMVCWEVLEHVLNPEAMLRDMAREMARSSTLLLCVPNMASLAAKVLHERAPMFGTGHLNMFTPETLRQMLLKVMPDAEVEFFSIVSWAKELSNHYNFKGPFDDDHPHPMHFQPQLILDQLLGYKLVCIAKRR